MKTKPILKEFLALLAKKDELQLELEQTRQRVESGVESGEIDLRDTKAMEGILEARARCDLIPRAVEGIEKRLAVLATRLDQELRGEYRLLSDQLGKIEEIVTARIRKDFAPHFNDPVQLAAAVRGCDSFKKALNTRHELEWGIINGASDVPVERRAEKFLASAAEAERILSDLNKK